MKSSLSVEQRVLALLCSRREDFAEEAVAIIRESFDWIRFIWLARYHKLSPLVFRAIKGIRREISVPSSIFDQFEMEARENIRVDAFKEEAMERVSTLFSGRVACCRFFDPSLRSQLCWNEDGLCSHDYEPLQIIVSKKERSMACRLLQSLGYVERGKGMFAIDAPFHLASLPRNVDWLLGKNCPSFERNWGREELLVYLCCSSARSLWRKWPFVIDIHALLSRYGHLIDWNRVWRLADKASLYVAVEQGLCLADKLTGSETVSLGEKELLPVVAKAASSAFDESLAPSEMAALEKLRGDSLRVRLARRVYRSAKSVVIGFSRFGIRSKAGHYIPSSPKVVREILDLAQVSEKDVVYDLGCGDGRILISAAKRMARGVGIDIDPDRIAESKKRAREYGVDGRIEFCCGSLFEVSNLAEATLVVLYLDQCIYPKVETFLLKRLSSGTRVVSHRYFFPNWKALESRIVRVSPGRLSYLYLWAQSESVNL